MKIEYHPKFFKSLKRMVSLNPFYAIPRWSRSAWWSVKAAWHRVYKGYDDSWLWGFRDVFPRKIIATLTYMIENLHSWPSGKAKTFEDWRKILKQMRKGFQAIEKLNNQEYMEEDKDGKYKWNKGKLKAWEKQAEKGLELFKEYFFCLWD